MVIHHKESQFIGIVGTEYVIMSVLQWYLMLAAINLILLNIITFREIWVYVTLTHRMLYDYTLKYHNNDNASEYE